MQWKKAVSDFLEIGKKNFCVINESQKPVDLGILPKNTLKNYSEMPPDVDELVTIVVNSDELKNELVEMPGIEPGSNV